MCHIHTYVIKNNFHSSLTVETISNYNFTYIQSIHSCNLLILYIFIFWFFALVPYLYNIPFTTVYLIDWVNQSKSYAILIFLWNLRISVNTILNKFLCWIYFTLYFIQYIQTWCRERIYTVSLAFFQIFLFFVAIADG